MQKKNLALSSKYARYFYLRGLVVFALNQASVIKRFGELNIVRMKADWTLKDPVITATLAEFGRNGVPLYVLYPKSGNPIVLPEVLTPSILLSAVDANGGAKTASR